MEKIASDDGKSEVADEEKKWSAVAEHIFTITVAIIFREVNWVGEKGKSEQLFTIYFWAPAQPLSWNIKVGEIVHGKLIIVGHTWCWIITEEKKSISLKNRSVDTLRLQFFCWALLKEIGSCQ